MRAHRLIQKVLVLVVTSTFWCGGTLAQSVKPRNAAANFKVGHEGGDAVEARVRVAEPQLWSSLILPAKRKTYPVFVFLPGILGSKLERLNPQTKQWEMLWGVTRFKQLGFGKSQDIGYREGDNIRASPLYDFEIAGLVKDIYGKALAMIRQKAITAQETLLPFAYDWRQDNERSGDDLNAFLCNKSEALRGRPIVFVAHSMGGLVLKSWLMKHYSFDDEILKCKDGGSPGLKLTIQEIMFLGTPHMGSPKAIKAFADGFQLIGDDKTLFGALFGEIDKRTLAKALNDHGATFPSVYQLLPIYGSEVGCVQRKFDDPPEPLLVSAGGEPHARFDLFAARAWKSIGWPKNMPALVSDQVFYDTLLPHYLERARTFLCKVASYVPPPRVSVRYFVGRTALTDQTFVISNIVGRGDQRGSSSLQHKEGAYASGDGTVPWSVASNLWLSQGSQRQTARAEHAALLNADEVEFHVDQIFWDASYRAQSVWLASGPQARAVLQGAYKAVNAVAPVPADVARWNDAEAQAVQSFNASLNVDARVLVAQASTLKDARSRASLLAAAATSGGVSDLVKADALNKLSMTQLQLGNWSNATAAASAAMKIAEVLPDRNERQTILKESLHNAGWAYQAMNQSDKAGELLSNALKLGNAGAFRPPVPLAHVEAPQSVIPNGGMPRSK